MKLLTIFLLSIFIGNPSLTDIRNNFEMAATSSEAAQKMSDKLASIDKTDSKVLLAYKGAAMTLTAKYSKIKKEKSSKFKAGVALIEYAIAQEPMNIEIRFIRLSIQENTPPFLRYKKKIKEDKELILNRLDGVKSLDLAQHIKKYIANSKAFSETEKQTINQ